MTTEQEQALVDSLQDLERDAQHMAARTMPSGEFHEGRADAFAEVLALLKLAGIDVKETTR